MCPTCWNLVELMADFKQCCKKATRKLKCFVTGLDYGNEADNWMAEGTLMVIEEMRETVQMHLNQLDVPKAFVEEQQPKKEASTDQGDVPDEPKEVSNECSADFTMSNTEFLQQLEEIQHDSNIFSCERCNRNFDGLASIRAHKQHCRPGVPAKEKYFSCPICTATFIENSGLSFHMNKHKGIRPYKCRKFCDHTFFSNYSRIKHERNYCQREGLVCDICGLYLKNEGSLKAHLKNVHGEAKYACSICGRKFRSSKSRRLHLRVHSDERKYSCTMCDKSFKASYGLKVHIRTHTQEFPFVCHLCGHAFNYKVSLRSHMEQHHGSNE